jgi:hypothetical protein
MTIFSLIYYLMARCFNLEQSRSIYFAINIGNLPLPVMHMQCRSFLIMPGNIGNKTTGGPRYMRSFHLHIRVSAIAN